MIRAGRQGFEEGFPAQTQPDMLAMWIEAIMDAVELDHLEPDMWEALYLAYAMGGPP